MSIEIVVDPEQELQWDEGTWVCLLCRKIHRMNFAVFFDGNDSYTNKWKVSTSDPQEAFLNDVKDHAYVDIKNYLIHINKDDGRPYYYLSQTDNMLKGIKLKDIQDFYYKLKLANTLMNSDMDSGTEDIEYWWDTK